MDFPVYETQPAAAPPTLLAALGISTVENVAYNRETEILLLEIKEPEILAALRTGLFRAVPIPQCNQRRPGDRPLRRRLRFSLTVFLALERHQRRPRYRRHPHLFGEVLVVSSR